MARCLIAAGAQVVLVGRRKLVLEEATGNLGEGAHCRVHDVLRYDQNAALIDEVESTIGPLQILINNAGIHLKKPAINTSEAEFQSVLDTHLTAAFSLTRAAATKMLLRGHGSILFIASMASFIGVPNVLAYSAAKAAYLGIVRGLAAGLSPNGIRENAIAPGWIHTPMTDQALSGDPSRKQRILDRTPMNRLGEPGDIGYAAVYLSSSAARFVTGAVLVVDGGASIGF
jgi:NAD(P)-dependent dehydrogenase (short-subunit alcohol dehydrogenase family)